MDRRNYSPIGGFTDLDAMVEARGPQISRASKYPLKYLHLHSFEKLILMIARVWMKYWNKLQDQIRDGTAPECFVKQLAESNYREKGISEIQAAYLSGCTSPTTPHFSPPSLPLRPSFR